uniref:Uncharacterized protein n=1 Tax=Manihot esculenta TaxID=3983 RepID=A0A2C9V964_MANES
MKNTEWFIIYDKFVLGSYEVTSFIIICRVTTKLLQLRFRSSSPSLPIDCHHSGYELAIDLSSFQVNYHNAIIGCGSSD